MPRSGGILPQLAEGVMTRTPLYLVTADMPPRPYSGDPVLQELGHATHRVPLSRERALRRAACSRTWGSFDSVTAASASRAACAEGASISGWGARRGPTPPRSAGL